MKIFKYSIVLSFLFLVLGCESREEEFWSWFKKNEDRIYNFENNQDQIFAEIKDHLHKYKEGLVFEISRSKEGTREFVVSGDGIKEYFPDVTSLVSKAPELDRWDIIAFRPRIDSFSEFKLVYEGVEFSPDNILFKAVNSQRGFDLVIFHPKYTEDDRNIIIGGSYILLDMAIGEFDVATGIRYINFKPMPQDVYDVDLLPISKLRSVFDSYKHSKSGG